MSGKTELEKELSDRNTRLVIILGASTSLISVMKCQTDREVKLREWILEAIDATIYKNEPLPPLPPV